MAEAVCEMVIDHPGGLHEGITDGAADELETAALEFPADFVGQLRARRHFRQRLRVIDDRPAV